MCKRSVTLRALVTERLTAAAEEIFALVERTMAEYEEELSCSKEENHRKQQLLDEALRQLHGKENLHLANPAEENVAVWKQENSDDPQTQDALCVQVKEEDLDEFPIALHWEDTGVGEEINWEHPDELDVTDTDKIENIEPWQIEVNNDAEGDQLSKKHHRKRTDVSVKLAGLTKKCKMTQAQKFAKEKALAKTCRVCKIKFLRHCDLKKHLKTNHQSQQRPHSCPICQKGFTQPSCIKMHIKAVHMPEERPFGCSVCEMAFKTKGGLMKHMYQHTGRRAFACSVCQDNFKRKYELERHMLKHTK